MLSHYNAFSARLAASAVAAAVKRPLLSVTTENSSLLQQLTALMEL